MNTKTNILLWILRILAALIMLQTLYFKFSGHPDSIYIFEKLGVEPFGRYGAGISELIASTILLIPRTTRLGSLMGLGIMSGAIASHLFILGIHVNGDGGTLFTLALVTFFCCLLNLILSKRPLLPL